MRYLRMKFLDNAKKSTPAPMTREEEALLGVSEEDLITLSAEDSHLSEKVSKSPNA